MNKAQFQIAIILLCKNKITNTIILYTYIKIKLLTFINDYRSG